MRNREASSFTLEPGDAYTVQRRHGTTSPFSGDAAFSRAGASSEDRVSVSGTNHRNGIRAVAGKIFMVHSLFNDYKYRERILKDMDRNLSTLHP